jgi:hypothetical protein
MQKHVNDVSSVPCSRQGYFQGPNEEWLYCERSRSYRVEKVYEKTDEFFLVANLLKKRFGTIVGEGLRKDEKFNLMILSFF